MNRDERLQQLEEKIRREKNDKIKYVLLQELADTFIEEENFNFAFRIYEQAFTVAQKMRNRKFMCDTLIDLASTAEQLGMIDRAVSFYEDAFKLAQDIRNFREQRRIRGMLGMLAAKAGNLRRAADYFEEATNIAPLSEAKLVHGEEEKDVESISAELEEEDLPRSSMLQLSTEVSNEIKRTARFRRTQRWVTVTGVLLIAIAVIDSSKYLPTLLIVILTLVIIVGIILVLNDIFPTSSDRNRVE